MTPPLCNPSFRLLMFVVLSFTPGISLASSAALNWDACDSGTLAKTFACDTNVGTARIVVSAVLDPEPNGLLGVRCVLDVVVDSAELPEWWQLASGGCRSGQVSSSGLWTAADASCLDAWEGLVLVTGTPVLTLAPGRLRIIGVGALPAGIASVTPAVESFLLAVTLSYSKTVGGGSCSGCERASCVLLRELTLDVPGSDDVFVQIPDSTSLLSWQATPATCRTTPSRNKTWGSIKSLFR